jgi:sn-glycerol 3-phosphate transport system substrate-binding protein
MRKLLNTWLILTFLFALIPLTAMAAPATQEAAACEFDVVVQADDWLSKISDKYYGDFFIYPAIVEATNQQHALDASYALIDNPDIIEPGWKLCIPTSTDAQALVGAELGRTEPAPEAITLTYWYTTAAADVQQELVDIFNASQDEIFVVAELQGAYGDLATNLLTAHAAGVGPEVTQLGTFEIVQFAKSGVLVDLKPFIEGSDGIDTTDWPGTMLSAGEIDGQIVWLPLNVSVPVLYYNSEAFAEAGLPGPPETWEQFYDYARRLTVKDENGVVQRTGTALWGISWPLLSNVWSEGGEFTTKDYSNVTLNDPVVVSVMAEYQKLVQEGAATLPDAASGGHRAAFKNGQAAMILDSPAPFAEILAESVGFTPAVANYPAGAAGKVYAPGGGGIAMMAITPEDKRAAAWTFIKFLLEDESVALLAERSGYAAFHEGARQAAGSFLTDQSYATMHEALPFLRGDFSMNTSPAVRTAFDEALQKILLQNADVQVTLDEADAKAEEGLKNEVFAP